MSDDTKALPPILADKARERPSVFAAEGLLREARRQKVLPEGRVPPLCVLDRSSDPV